MRTFLLGLVITLAGCSNNNSMATRATNVCVERGHGIAVQFHAEFTRQFHPSNDRAIFDYYLARIQCADGTTLARDVLTWREIK